MRHLLDHVGPVFRKELLDAVRDRRSLMSADAALLVIDPLQSYLGADVNLHRVNEVRPVLDRLCAVASRSGCSVLAVCHWTKGETTRALHRIQGSADLVNRARSVLLAGQIADGRRVLVHAKSNLGHGAWGSDLLPAGAGLLLLFCLAKADERLAETRIDTDREPVEADRLQLTGIDTDARRRGRGPGSRLIGLRGSLRRLALLLGKGGGGREEPEGDNGD